MSETTTDKPAENVGIDPHLFLRLAAPFSASEIKCKPGVVSGNRAMAIWFIDARLVQDRLDEVMGNANWKTEYHQLANGTVECRLSLRINGEWITKADVGGESGQPDEGDRTKSAYSDSLKRAAVSWGIGRYLYRIPAQWCDYDAQKKKFINPPRPPSSCLPAAEPATPRTEPAKPKPDGPAVDGRQNLSIKSAMADAGLTGEQFYKKFGCDTDEVPAAMFEQVMAAIAGYMARKNQKERQAATNGAR